MKNEKWQQINQIFEAVLELAPSERTAFINKACADDKSLRQEIESLLASHNEAESFLEQPAVNEVAEIVLGRNNKLSIGQNIGHYKILKELGKGGQGAVYQALDGKLNRTVALKTLPPELTIDETSRKRFEREAQLASSLDHPNICTVHDLTEIEGNYFIVMQFVEGKNIRQLVNGKPLELKSALKIAIQVCDALANAHNENIIHRDIKAHNIIVTEKGVAKILDFGLAKITNKNAEEQTELTALGSPYGTPTYAAPEQSRGEKVDWRADIFSTGVLIYEMLTGTWAFHGKTAVDVRHAVLHDEPKPITERRGEAIPQKLQAIVDKALAKEPQNRYQKIGEMRDELIEVLRELPEGEQSETARFLDNFKPIAPRHLWDVSYKAKLLTAVMVILIVAITSFAVYRFIQTNQQTQIESIAVMPFVNTSQDQNAEYLADGLTDSLINNLSQLPSLKVISRSAVFRFKGKETDAPKIANELKVRTILTGDVKQIGDQLTINVELINADDNRQIWGERYVRKLSDILTVQKEITQEISNKLRLKLSGAQQQQLAKNYTENAEAYQLYLKGNYYQFKFTPEGVRKSIEYYNQALEKDANFALAYAGLGNAYIRLITWVDTSPADTFRQAKSAAEKALQLDETLAEAHIALAKIKSSYEWDWIGAENDYKRAIDLNPNNAEAHQSYGSFLLGQERFNEAVAETKKSSELEPLSVFYSVQVCRVYHLAGREDEALANCQTTLEMDANYPLTHFVLGQIYLEKEMYQEAFAEFQTNARLISSNNPPDLMVFAYYYAVTGNKDEAKKRLAELEELANKRFVPSDIIAIVYSALNDKDKTFEWLEKAYQQHYFHHQIKVTPLLKNVRNDARFKDLLERLKLRP